MRGREWRLERAPEADLPEAARQPLLLLTIALSRLIQRFPANEAKRAEVSAIEEPKFDSALSRFDAAS
jgi:hypothetical protein